ncbi:MAG: radical SAM protein [Fimbriimonadaceae bacterium]|jgi:DNA repair photolyase|nr:radical SAM protein [Fimbriimonadaceae bacterium]
MALQPMLFEPTTLQIPRVFGQTKVEKIVAKSILNRGVGMLSGHDFSLNPYGGCQFGCAYCYAAFFQPDLELAETWGQWVQVKENALGLLRRQPDLPGAHIYLGSATDPYQPIEAKAEITRSLLLYMAGLAIQPKIVVQTRSPLVTRDIEILKRFSSLRVNMSITTDDEEIRKIYEPSCASIRRRIQAVEELKAAGIKTCICVSPMLPISDPLGFAEQLVATGADKITTSFFHRQKGRSKFASATRDIALELAHRHNWDSSAYLETSALMQKVLSRAPAHEVFGPEGRA